MQNEASDAFVVFSTPCIFIFVDNVDEQSAHDEGDDEDPDQPIFSLVTGKYRHARRYEGKVYGVYTSFYIERAFQTRSQLETKKVQRRLFCAVRTIVSQDLLTVLQVGTEVSRSPFLPCTDLQSATSPWSICPRSRSADCLRHQVYLSKTEDIKAWRLGLAKTLLAC